MEIIPFDKRQGHIWYNGNIIPWQDGKIHILNHGLHYASCVFEGIRVYNRKIFKLTEHSERFISSAKILGFDIPYSLEELNEATKSIVEKQEVIDGYIRPLAWRGSEKMNIGATNQSIHTAIACWQWPNYYANKASGIRLTFAKWARPAPNTAPTSSKAAGLYMICTLSAQAAVAEGYNDALMLDYRGYIAESTASNFFMVINNELHTPIADCFLNGITRQTVIKLAKDNNIKLVERHIKPEELENATEIFLTGTAAEITPVISIKDYKYDIGPITKLLMEKYKNLCLS